MIFSQKQAATTGAHYLMAVRFKRSYHDRKEAVARRRKTVLRILIICFTFQILFSVFLSTIRIDSVSMEPGLDQGNVMIYSPFIYGLKINLLNSRLPQIQSPERGDLVVFTPPYIEKKEGALVVLSSIVNFLTFGKVDLTTLSGDKWDNRQLIKRIIAIPGDTVRMYDFKASIKPAGSNFFLSEFEVIDIDYDIKLGQLPAGWDSSLPFSGNMEAFTLEEGQYFVLGDNRMQSSDSTNWGFLDRERIVGKVIFNYWPLSKIAPIP